MNRINYLTVILITQYLIVCKAAYSVAVLAVGDELVVESSLIGLVWPRTGRRYSYIVDVFITWKMARARLRGWHSKETQQRPQSVARFRRTRWKAAVLSSLPDADGLVGSTHLDAGERQYWDDAVTLFDVLSHDTTYHTHTYHELPL